MSRQWAADQVALDAHIAQAAAALDAAAGSSSLCSLSRAGVPMPGIKYPEGAWAALREVRRATSHAGDVASAAAAVRDRWATDLQRREQGGSGSDWVAYLTGGVDAVDSLLAEVTPGS